MLSILRKCRSRFASVSKGKKRIIVCVISLICILFAAAGAYVLRHFYTETFGLRISPARDFPEVDYTYSRIFSSRTIDRALESHLLPIVNVRYMGGGATHWVMVVGAENGDYLVLDPLHAGKDPIPLSTHGKVHAYRVLYSTAPLTD